MPQQPRSHDTHGTVADALMHDIDATAFGALEVFVGGIAAR